MNSIFENFLILNGYRIDKAAAELKSIKNLGKNAFEKWNHEKKWNLVKHHFENSKKYKSLFQGQLPKNWDDLPIMEKTDYQDDLSNLISAGYDLKEVYVSNTSGSSGHPFFFAKNKYAHAMTWAMIKDRFSYHGINLNSSQARFFGIPLETTHWTKEKIKDWMGNRTRFPIFDLSDNICNSFLKKFKRKKFKYLYGYVNSLVVFAKFLLKNQILLKSICPTIKCCITTSEMLIDEDRILLREAFGVKIINEYGVSEVGGVLAFEDEEGNWLINKETMFIEIINEDGSVANDGESGEILITDLYNKAMPFIRYKVGDLGIIKNGEKINNYKILHKLIGRTNDNIILPSGKISPGLTFYYISKSILESEGFLKEFIIRQIELDTFIFDVIASRELKNNEINKIKEKMTQYLEPNLILIINRVDKIKRPKSGKIKHFYCEIGD